ncbi:transcriptional regulator with PAS, ATPase and Fis domain [Enterococcus sp. PF1-24]|uniref:sigma-54 interaction domain-containing protein n=1 Tax=unclassified Enterococcus TaxID=2608891 RepID=UPI0024754DC4|nr:MULTISPECIES: sigma 54-interacting transcriptional regulator [unclassified Enterococcus]MDH6364754.1 transcriptional regulator with PAS, ATPase and Fis domain [Enterococcus sp. PFB1-1]MDH6401901.1 transcriptional regulator with PAS, ATPase and Fis domain [Enterococcus sp. PF1-24]
MENHFNFENPLFSKMVFEQLGTFAILDRLGNYTYVTQSWASYFNCLPGEVIGKKVTEFFPETKALEAMENKTPIIAYPVGIKPDNIGQQFVSYFPLFHEKKVIGCIIQTIFHDLKEATIFSKTFNQLQSERNYYCQELQKLRASKYSIDSIIGESKAIKKMKELIYQAANSPSNIVIEGETGTGKELVSHAIHMLSNRSEKPLIKLNCAAIPVELAESELFGYEYGAFTGAKAEGKMGKFELANQGTLFLDEINHLSMVIQPKLLRAIQEQEIERVGGMNTIYIDVRLIVATNIPLRELVEKKLFRNDLFYRLNVITIRIPPLRERLEDLPLLIDSIIKRLNMQLGTSVTGIDSYVLEQFQHYHWPGNIRELQNVLERAMNSRLSGYLTWQEFADYFDLTNCRHLKQNVLAGSNRNMKTTKQELEISLIRETLSQLNGNKKKTAEQLGISRTLLYKKLKKYQITLD